MAGPGALVRPSRGHPRSQTQMLQQLAGSGSGRHCRLSGSLSAPLCCPVHRTVLLFPAEDSWPWCAGVLDGICSTAGVRFQSLPVEVITAPTLRLDLPTDKERLTNTVQIHLSFTPPDCTHNFVQTGTIIIPPDRDLIVVNHWQHYFDGRRHYRRHSKGYSANSQCRCVVSLRPVSAL
jgi:hypothetical protein